MYMVLEQVIIKENVETGHKDLVYSNITDKLVEASLNPHDPNEVIDICNKPSVKADIKFNDKVRLSKHNENKNYIEN